LIDILPHSICVLLHFINQSRLSQSESTLEIPFVSVENEGEVRALIKRGPFHGTLFVTLNGRPVDSYLKIVGTNGSLKLDFVRGIVIKNIGPGHDAISAVTQPFSSGFQTIFKSLFAFGKLALKKNISYQGLSELIEAFHKSILNQSKPPIPYNEIRDTVHLTEIIGKKLKSAEEEFELKAKERLMQKSALLTHNCHKNQVILVTGGTGFLGRVVTSELIRNGWPVRVLSRKIPAYSNQVPGVEYIETDLSNLISKDIYKDIVSIVHCAAETAGGKFEHERNTIRATQNLIKSAYNAGVKNFVHISSIAVLKTSRELGHLLDEYSPVDNANLSRGPYVWGKAEAEIIAKKESEKLGFNLGIIRLGPLVDYDNFLPPGRLGRSLGSSFIAVGNRKSKLSLCDVHTAARVITAYVSDFNSMPTVLNLIEPDEPTRAELVARMKKLQPELKIFWIPSVLIKTISPFLLVLQKILLPGKKPVNVQAAFTSETYKTDLAQQVIQRINQN
jgi:nucleoside-diphosphate-sugar epimerase